MCGIHGLLALADSARPDAALHGRMGGGTAHRGPDDDGYLLDGPLLIGTRRLSIIDLAGGRQPIANEDETLWVVCNGAIYNFRALRSTLERCGHRFRTRTDSEVIVHAYEEYGDDFVRSLDGMFAFALWDKRRRRLLIGRDRLGIKPLYYLHDATRVAFASETKALLAVPGVRAELDRDSLREYLALGYTSAPNSMLAGVRKLPPATLMVVEQGRVDMRRYWQLPAGGAEARDDDQWIEAARERMEQAVHEQMVSDVPLGAFLSGGIDSSAVVAFMTRHSGRPVKTYAIGFGHPARGAHYNELPYARRVAQLYGTDHREMEVTPDAASLLPRLLWHLDEPVADSAFVTTYLASELARRDVTVILCGVGGDELFGGYRRYLGPYYDGYYARIPRWLRRSVLAPIARLLPGDRHSPLTNLPRSARGYLLADEIGFEERYRRSVQVFDRASAQALLRGEGAAVPDALARAFENVASDDPIYRMLAVDLATQLPDDLLHLTDRMSMAMSLECRVPLLDTRLVELAARMPSRLKVHGRVLKHAMKCALDGVLPDDILHRKKRGFGAPMGAWLRNGLEPVLRSVLSRQSVERRGLFDSRLIDETIALHEANRADHTNHLLALLNLELWCRMYLDGERPADLSEALCETVKPAPRRAAAAGGT
jgi:asparagine synthase (glutamine-hydrolysing)